MSDLPLVSTVIPTFEREKELQRAIDSVLKQTYKGNIEIIIIDDSNIYNEYPGNIKTSPNRRIIYMNAWKRQGAPVARNRGIKQSKGKYVAFLDDDDTWMPTKIEKQVELMERYPDCPLVICYSHDMRFGQNRINRPPDIITHEMIIKSFNLSSTSSYLVRKTSLKKISIYDECLGTCETCKYRDICWDNYELDICNYDKIKCDDIRSALDAKQYFDVALSSAQEYDLAIRLSVYGAVRCIPEVLIEQKSTKGQISENWSRKIKGIKGIAKKYRSEYSYKDKIKTFGIVNLFRIAKIPGVGNKIYKIIIPIKELYEK